MGAKELGERLLRQASEGVIVARTLRLPVAPVMAPPVIALVEGRPLRAGRKGRLSANPSWLISRRQRNGTHLSWNA